MSGRVVRFAWLGRRRCYPCGGERDEGGRRGDACVFRWRSSGGLAGILLGRGVSMLFAAVLHWPVKPSLPAVIASFLVSAGVGIIFGYYPAWKASKLDPIEALRYE